MMMQSSQAFVGHTKLLLDTAVLAVIAQPPAHPPVAIVAGPMDLDTCQQQRIPNFIRFCWSVSRRQDFFMGDIVT